MRVGDELGGRFRLERKAGAGGMGVVYCARDLRDDRPVAIKCVVGSPLDLERFAHEAAVLAEVEHPRLVRYIDHGVAGEARYLAMEWLEGEDLAHRLARGRLDPPDAVQVARGVAEVLAALHARGIVHRDVKPSNVYLEGGRCDGVKLLDLGIARDQARAWNLTGTGMAIGTPAYMAPEQARGEPVDARADLFSLGCLVFECLAGRPPFHADHPLAALAKMLLEDAPRLADLGVAAPPALEELLAALLSREREARPADAAAVLAALDAWSRPALLAPPAPAAAISSAEQRIVSVVLTRPATAAGDTMLPQESGDLERRVRAAAAASQARLERLPGGSYLAHFAGAGVPTDHAARGASFALALAALLGTDTIALATGRGQLGGRTPTGAVIDRAVALSGGGGAGVQLDPLSATLLEDRFEILGDGERRQLLGERDVRVPRRTLLGRVTACVGRERELAALSAALATCIEEPVASAILITAPPGAGKSRLVDEFVRSARARPDVARVALGGCDVMSAGSAFGALSRALRQALREDGDEGPLGRLAARLQGRMSADAAARSAELLGELCGLVRDDQASADLRRLRSDPVLLSDAIAEAFRALIATETDAGALVLVLEDLHWGDLPSLRLIDSALRVLADRPLCVVATARPELHEQFPRLWAERGVQEIRLGALTRRPAERLARQVLGPGASDATIAQLVERAGGHPFLLEEMLRAAAAGHADELPDTVLGVVQARFDGLPEDARAALRAASVFGATFWLGGVAALLGAAPPAAPAASATPAPPPRDDPTLSDSSVVTLVGIPTPRGDQAAPSHIGAPPPRARDDAPASTARHTGAPPPRARDDAPASTARGRLPPVDAAAAVLARLVAAEFIEPRADSKLAGQREYTVSARPRPS